MSNQLYQYKEPTHLYISLNRLLLFEKLLVVIQQLLTVSPFKIGGELNISSEGVITALNRLLKFIGTKEFKYYLEGKSNMSPNNVVLIFKKGNLAESVNQDTNYRISIAIILYALRLCIKDKNSQIIIETAKRENAKQERLVKRIQEKQEKQKNRETKRRLAQQERQLRREMEKRRSQKELKRRRDSRIIKKFKNENRQVIKNFIEIAKRKASLLDEYGNYNLNAFPEESGKVIVFLIKSKRNYLTEEESARIAKFSETGNYNLLPYPYDILARYLHRIFRLKVANRLFVFNYSLEDIKNLAGIEFESYIAQRLKENGFRNIRGTPVTGDQGADLIAEDRGKRIAIQAKRHTGLIGNQAVQEIVGALKYYNADEGWVVTNSNFTKSAKDLAFKNQIILIDGYTLQNLTEFLGKIRMNRKI